MQEGSDKGPAVTTPWTVARPNEQRGPEAEAQVFTRKVTGDFNLTPQGLRSFCSRNHHKFHRDQAGFVYKRLLACFYDRDPSRFQLLVGKFENELIQNSIGMYVTFAGPYGSILAKINTRDTGSSIPSIDWDAFEPDQMSSQKRFVAALD
ncbi:hypothetical protein MMC31_002790 [Peltigera leucophlebia]|nr:hypothetical protein [Peltigera leucophlebia]